MLYITVITVLLGFITFTFFKAKRSKERYERALNVVVEDVYTRYETFIMDEDTAIRSLLFWFMESLLDNTIRLNFSETVLQLNSTIFTIISDQMPKGRARQKASVLRAARMALWKSQRGWGIYTFPAGTNNKTLPKTALGPTYLGSTAANLGQTWKTYFDNGDENLEGFLDTITLMFIGTNGKDIQGNRHWFKLPMTQNSLPTYVHLPELLTNAAWATGIAGNYNSYLRYCMSVSKYDIAHKMAQMLISWGYDPKKTVATASIPQIFLMWPYGYTYTKLTDDEAELVRQDLQKITTAMVSQKKSNAVGEKKALQEITGFKVFTK